MKLGIYIVVAILACFINCYYWELRAAREDDKTIKYIKPYIPHSKQSKLETVAMLVLMVAIAFVLGFYHEENSIVYTLKRLLLVAYLFPIALSDYRKHIIPNTALLVCLVSWVILTIFEFIFNNDVALFYLIGELIYMLLFFAGMMVLKLIIRGGIGMGDVKLFMVLALLQGSDGVMSSVTTSLFVLFVAAVILLITKKKKKKDFIPFAPAILVGTYISVLLIGA